MSTAKNSLIAVLALTTCGAAAFAWREYQQLAELRAADLVGKDERANLRKQIWDLQKSNRDLMDQVAASRGVRGPRSDATARAELAEGPDGAPPFAGGRGRGQQFAMMRQLMQKPEVQAIISSAEKAVIDARYAALFKSLNLSSDQTAKLTSLLADRQTAVQDVFAAAREQGINPRSDPDAFKKLVADAQSPINDSIKSLLGDDGYSQLTNYEQTMPQRNLVNVLQQRLNNTDSPLSSSQADQLVQILAANGSTRAAEPGMPPRPGGDFGGGPAGRIGALLGGGLGGGAGAIVGPNAAQITPEAVAQAGTVLNSTQLGTLQQLQQQQQNIGQLEQMMRSTWQQSNTGAATGTGGTAAGGTGTPSTPAPGSRGPGH